MKLAHVLMGAALMAILSSTDAQAQIKLPTAPSPAAPAPASTPNTGGLISSIRPEATIPILETAGFTKNEIYVNGQDRHIKSMADGREVYTFHEACNQGDCVQLRFFVLFGKQADVDLKFVNAFNRVRFSKLAIDSDGDLYLDYSAFLRGGVTAANIKAHAELFRGSIKGALEFKPPQ